VNNTTPIPTPPRLSTAETSIYTGIPASTLRFWRHQGSGPASYSIGARVFYDVVDLDAWVAAQKAASVRGGDSK
jgi:hypothetical protein